MPHLSLSLSILKVGDTFLTGEKMLSSGRGSHGHTQPSHKQLSTYTRGFGYLKDGETKGQRGSAHQLCARYKYAPADPSTSLDMSWWMGTGWLWSS